MNRRLAVALVAFVLWTAITVIGGNITTGGNMTLVQAVQSGIGWTWVVAASFILAVVLWQGWRDVGLDRGADARGWRLCWLPTIYIVGGLGLATAMGLPPVTVLLVILVNTLLVGFSEELDVPRRAPAGVPPCHVDMACGTADFGGLRLDP